MTWRELRAVPGAAAWPTIRPDYAAREYRLMSKYRTFSNNNKIITLTTNYQKYPEMPRMH